MSKKSNAFFENGSWYHRTRILNDDYTTTYSKKGGFKTKEEAEESYLKTEEIYNKATIGNVLSLDESITLKEYLNYWFKNIFSERIESTTKMVTAYAIYNLIYPNIENDIKLSLVTSSFINSLLSKIEALIGKPSARKAKEVLSISFKDAIIEKIITYNPMEEVVKFNKERKSINILNKEQLKIFLSYVSRENWYLEIILGLFCGLRKGEIQGLKFSDFDIKEKTVSISRQIVGEYTFEENMEKKGFKIKEYSLKERNPKTINAYRKIRVPDLIIEQLKIRKQLIGYYKKKNENYEDNDYISCQSNGNPHSLSSLNGYIRRTCQKLQLPLISVHSLRHMYATILMEQGVELVKISALLGHDSINTTFEYYCDVMEDNEKINKFINKKFQVK